MSDPVAACDETDADAGRVGLLDDADLLLSRPAPAPPRRLSRFACVGISHRDHSCPHRRIRTRGLKPSHTFVNAARVGHGSTADARDQSRSDVRRRYALCRHLAEQHSASVRDALKGILHPVQRCSRTDATAVPTVNRIRRRFEGRSAGPHAKPGAARRAARTSDRVRPRGPANSLSPPRNARRVASSVRLYWSFMHPAENSLEVAFPSRAHATVPLLSALHDRPMDHVTGGESRHDRATDPGRGCPIRPDRPLPAPRRSEVCRTTDMSHDRGRAWL